MLKPGREPDLPLKAVVAQARGKLRVQHLERHRPVVAEVAGEVHRRHPAAPQLTLDGVTALQGGSQLAPLVGHQEPPSTSFWNRGFFRSGSKVGSLRSHPGDR